jgi:hypothetical protein
MSLVGDHTVTITASYAALGWSDTQSTTVTFNDDCASTTLNPISVASMSSSVLGGTYSRLIVANTVTHACGTLTLSIVTSESFITFNQATMTVYAAPTLDS